MRNVNASKTLPRMRRPPIPFKAALGYSMQERMRRNNIPKPIEMFANMPKILAALNLMKETSRKDKADECI
jgi:hypothetical protein